MTLEATDDARGRSHSEPAGVGAPTLLFMHIPKTAGTSMRAALSEAFTPQERLWIYDPVHIRFGSAVKEADFPQLPEEQRRGLRLAFGHFGFGMHTSIPRPSTYVTLLRDPVDRAASLYYHYRYHKGIRYRLFLHRWRKHNRAAEERSLIERDRMSLQDWVFERKPLQLDNGMVRSLSGRRGIHFGQCPDDMLTEAMEHVDEHFAALLVSSDIARSTQLLEAITGRSLPRVPRRNVNRKRAPISEVDAGVRARIAELNHLDIKLHREALARFPDAYARLVG